MAANKTLNIAPIALTATLTTNILNCNITSLAGPVGFTMTQPYIIIKHARVTNKSASPVAVSLWKGASAGNVAGTEWNWSAVSVPANSYIESYSISRFDAADFLVGGAGTVSTLTLVLEGEIGVSG